MTKRHQAISSRLSLPPLPLNAAHWDAICKVLQLSPRQIAVAELMLRDAGNQEIVAALGISEGTLKTQQRRLYSRTGTSSRVQLAMRVLALSHEVRDRLDDHSGG